MIFPLFFPWDMIIRYIESKWASERPFKSTFLNRIKTQPDWTTFSFDFIEKWTLKIDLAFLFGKKRERSEEHFVDFKSR